jgi:hypothetical protein
MLSEALFVQIGNLDDAVTVEGRGNSGRQNFIRGSLKPIAAEENEYCESKDSSHTNHHSGFAVLRHVMWRAT